MNGFTPKGGDQRPGSGKARTDFKRKKRKNNTHSTTTAPELRPMREELGKKSRL